MTDPDVAKFLQFIVETVEHVSQWLDTSLTLIWSYSDNSMDMKPT